GALTRPGPKRPPRTRAWRPLLRPRGARRPVLAARVPSPAVTDRSLGQDDAARPGPARPGSAWLGPARPGSARLGPARPGPASAEAPYPRRGHRRPHGPVVGLLGHPRDDLAVVQQHH